MALHSADCPGLAGKASKPGARAGEARAARWMWLVWPLLTCLLAASPVEARTRQGLYLGFGLAAHSPAGELTGEQALVLPEQALILMERVQAGGGLELQVGYGLTPVVALELRLAVTEHSTFHESAPSAGSASVLSQMAGLRVAWPLGAAAEFFGLFGIGGQAIRYAANAYAPSSFAVADSTYYLLETAEPSWPSMLSGSGSAAGIGLSFPFLNGEGQLALLRQELRFERLRWEDSEARIPGLSVVVTSLSGGMVFRF